MIGPLSEHDILIVVDIQNDFCPDGALAVPRGDEVVPVVNRLAASFPHVLLTQDWHPRNHQSFASAHPGRKPYDTVETFYGAQVLWPDHCVQGTAGAAFRPDLHIPQAELILRKGYRKTIDSYSAFYENDRKTPTGLSGYLRARIPGRSRFRFLRALFGRGCRARRVQGGCDRGCLPRHRRGRLRRADPAIASGVVDPLYPPRFRLAGRLT